MEEMIQKCTQGDLAALREISLETFKETFADLNTESNMNAYLAASFNESKLKKELDCDESGFYFIYSGGDLAGYLKLNEKRTQTDVHDPASLEIERIYVRGGFQGQKIGLRLMEFAVQSAKAKNLSYLWLGVWEKNEKAIEFYTKNGFYRWGRHTFVIGDEVQTDYLMRRDIA